MKALRCILAVFVLVVSIPLPAEAYSPILTVLNTKKKSKQLNNSKGSCRATLGLLTEKSRLDKQMSSLDFAVEPIFIHPKHSKCNQIKEGRTIPVRTFSHCAH